MGVTFAPPGHRIALDGSVSFRRRKELGFDSSAGKEGMERLGDGGCEVASAFGKEPERGTERERETTRDMSEVETEAPSRSVSVLCVQLFKLKFWSVRVRERAVPAVDWPRVDYRSLLRMIRGPDYR